MGGPPGRGSAHRQVHLGWGLTPRTDGTWHGVMLRGCSRAERQVGREEPSVSVVGRNGEKCVSRPGGPHGCWGSATRIFDLSACCLKGDCHPCKRNKDSRSPRARRSWLRADRRDGCSMREVLASQGAAAGAGRHPGLHGRGSRRGAGPNPLPLRALVEDGSDERRLCRLSSAARPRTGAGVSSQGV